MKKFIIIFYFFMVSCATVSTKVNETANKEKKFLNSFLKKNEINLTKKMGKPNKIEFRENNRNRFYIYKNNKLGIKCERVFEINQNNLVVGYSSKNCF